MQLWFAHPSPRHFKLLVLSWKWFSPPYSISQIQNNTVTPHKIIPSSAHRKRLTKSLLYLDSRPEPNDYPNNARPIFAQLLLPPPRFCPIYPELCVRDAALPPFLAHSRELARACPGARKTFRLQRELLYNRPQAAYIARELPARTYLYPPFIRRSVAVWHALRRGPLLPRERRACARVYNRKMRCVSFLFRRDRRWGGWVASGWEWVSGGNVCYLTRSFGELSQK